MATKTVDITEAQSSLPELVSLVGAGVEVILTKNSTPVACLVPVESPNEKKAGESADWLGCLEHLHVTVADEDIAAARLEMWADFPRNVPL
jgi:prevent-host-death family protein